MPSEYESLGYAYDLLYDIKTQEQLTNEIDYLVERLSGIAKLCRQDGYSIDDYILMMLHFPKDEAMKGEYEMKNILMKFDPATGEERPYPSHAAQWREWHGGTAWLFDPWTGRRRDARDVGSDVHGLLIVPAGTLGMDMGGGCSEKDNVACA